MTASRDKSELRRELRARRNRLTREERARAGESLCRQLSAQRLFLASRRIAAYLPNDGEIDTLPIVMRILGRNKTCYLPVLSRLSWDRLWFAPYHPDSVLAPNRYGIPEPRVSIREMVRAQALDLILVPLVGFDDHGNRLGMGKGFYDRSLAFLGERRHWRKPHLLGLAYEFQRLDRLPTDGWDIPLAGIVTDRGYYPAPGQ